MKISDALRAAMRPQEEVISPLHPAPLGPRWRDGLPPWPPRLLAGVLEPRRGYRFKPENLALYDLLRAEPPARRVVDLGAGSGSLLLAALTAHEGARGLGVELQEDAAARLDRTLQAHALDAAALPGDLRDEATRDAALRWLGGPPELIVSNPPFFPASWGRPSAEEGTRRSTHAEHGDARDFVHAAARWLAPEGRLWLVFDAARVAEPLMAAAEVGLCLQQALWLPDQRPGHEAQPFRAWLRLGAGQGAPMRRLYP